MRGDIFVRVQRIARKLLYDDVNASLCERSIERCWQVFANKHSNVMDKVESPEAGVEAVSRAFYRWYPHQGVIDEPLVYVCNAILVTRVLDIRLLDGNSVRVVGRRRCVLRKVVVHKNFPPTFLWLPLAEQGDFIVEEAPRGRGKVTNEDEADWGAGGLVGGHVGGGQSGATEELKSRGFLRHSHFYENNFSAAGSSP